MTYKYNSSESPAQGVAKAVPYVTTGSVVLSVFLIIYFIYKYTFDWPYNDDFGSVEWYQGLFFDHKYGFLDAAMAHEGVHPIGIHLLTTLLLFSIFGVHFNIVIAFDILFMLATAIGLCVYVYKNYTSAVAKIFAPFLIMIFSFHPVQTTHLVWAFEMGWFIINCALYINAMAVEVWRHKAIPVVLLLLIASAFASAHACILWICVIIHIALMQDFRHKYVFVGLLLTGFILNVIAIMHGDDSRGFSINPHNIVELSVYFLSLVGSSFSTRSNTALLILGSMITILTIVFVARSIWNRAPSGIERVALVFMFGAVGFLLTFTKGRYQYGLPWAIEDFHMGPMLVPLLIGLMLYAFRLYDEAGSSNAVKILSVASIVFVASSVPVSIPFMLERGEGMLRKDALAMHVACNSGYSKYIIESANIAVGYYNLIERQIPYLKHLCTSLKPDVVLMLEEMRAKYGTDASRPEIEDALTALWEVYATHLDLIAAFPPNAPDSASRLLEWARGDAIGGSVYEPKKLQEFSSIYQSIAGR